MDFKICKRLVRFVGRLIWLPLFACVAKFPFLSRTKCMNYMYCMNLARHIELGGGEGSCSQVGTPIWNRRGCSLKILNLTPKEDHLGVAQAFCDP